MYTALNINDVEHTVKLTLKPLHDSTDEIYDRFPHLGRWLIKKDGEVVGEFAYKHRPKNAGGKAWCSTIMPLAIPGGEAWETAHRMIYWCKDREHALEDLRRIFEGEPTKYTNR